MATLHQELGISMSLFEPLVISRTRLLRELGNEITAYSHTIDAFGGYGVGSASLTGDRFTAEDWYRNGIGRRIVTYNDAQQIIYEGFVNQVSIKGSGVSVSLGPLLEVTNRCRVSYTTMHYNTNPPIGGQSALTAEGEDVVSVGKYGILYEVVSAGMLQEVEALSIRDTHLRNSREPKSDQDVEIPGGSNFAVELSLAGYSAWLERFSYRQIGLGTQALSDKLRDVIMYDPNNFLSDNFMFIAANGFQVPITDDDERSAMSIIQDLVTRGDGNGHRFLFGIYADRVARYNQMPMTIKYTYSIDDPSQKVYENGTEVRPWNLLPGNWLRVADLLVGEPVPVDPRRDSRNLFIESLVYTAPYSLSISGSQFNAFPRALAFLTGTMAAVA